MADIPAGRLEAVLGLNAEQFEKGMKSAERIAHRAGRRLQSVGRSLTLNLTAPIVASTAAIVKSAADWETAMVGVAKTVDATEAELDALGKSFINLSNRIPVSSNELARIGALAGQLGVQTSGIVKFTETIAALGVSTNLTTEQAATSLARFANIMGTAEKDFDRLGSVIVQLGNNLATTEAEIVDMSLRVAGAGKIFGLAESEVFALSGAMSSLGVRTESGGTSISRTMISIANAVRTGGEELGLFARVAGASIGEFRALFERDAAGALLAFTEGLGKVEDAGGNLFAVLEQLGLGEVRVRDVLLRIASSGDLLRRSISLANQEWEANTALTAEAAKFYGRLSGQFQTLLNRVRNTAATIGGALRPEIDAILGTTKRWVQQLSEWIKKTKETNRELIVSAAKITLVAAALGPLAIALGAVSLALSALLVPLKAIVGFIGFLLTPVGALIAVVAGLSAALLSGALAWTQWGDGARELIRLIPLIGKPLDSFVFFMKEFTGNITTAFQRAISSMLDGMAKLLRAFSELPFISERASRKALESADAFQRWADSASNAADEIDRTIASEKILRAFSETRFDLLEALGIPVPEEARSRTKGAVDGVVDEVKTGVKGLEDALAGFGDGPLGALGGKKDPDPLERALKQIREQIEASDQIGDVIKNVRRDIEDLNARTDLDRFTLSVERGVEKIRELGESLPGAEVEQFVNEYREQMAEFGDISERAAGRFNLGSVISGSLREITTGVLRGTREFGSALQVMNDIGVSIVSRMFEEMIAEKTKFDLFVEKNFLKDLPSIFKQFGQKAKGALSGIFDLGGDADTPTQAVAGETEATRDAAAKGLEAVTKETEGFQKGFGDSWDRLFDTVGKGMKALVQGVSGFVGQILASIALLAGGGSKTQKGLAIANLVVSGLGSLVGAASSFGGGAVGRGGQEVPLTSSDLGLLGVQSPSLFQSAVPARVLSVAAPAAFANLTGAAAGALDINVNVAEPVSIVDRGVSGGRRVLEVIGETARNAVADDIARGSRTAQAFEGAFGARRRGEVF